MRKLTEQEIADVRDKIIMRSIVSIATGCWEWTGRKHNMGYGRVSCEGNSDHLAHRAAYRAWVGPIPANKEIDHLCRNRRCVNPAHLEVVTHRENVRRGGKMLKDICSRGHKFDYLKKNGHRGCSTCDKEDAKVAYARKDKVKAKAELKAWHEQNPGKYAEYQRRSMSKPKTRAKRNAYLREYRKKPEVREKMRSQHRAWVDKNRDYVNEQWRKNYWKKKGQRDASN